MNFIKSISNFLSPYSMGNVPSSAPDFQAIIRSYVPDEPEKSLRVIRSRINDDLERYFEDNPGALEELIATANEGGTHPLSIKKSLWLSKRPRKEALVGVLL
ncbi:MAG: hypothetical protein LBF25_00835 [Puniceicoccales bacterium]|nr:hypothetical protein [Puniceicoccales bacterium]